MDLRRTGVVASDGMVASAHTSVSLVGAQVLAEGGNAIDAALAMSAMASVGLPAMCGLGGDGFAVVYDAARQRYLAIEGSGFGPDGGTPDFYRRRGLTAVPIRGFESVAVPGLVSCVEALLPLATRTLGELWEHAAVVAERGIALTAGNVEDIGEHEDLLRADGPACALFLPGGRVPGRGDRLVQRDLARTLRTVAADPHSFYEGELAEQFVTTLRDGGAPFSGEEWAAQRALVGPSLEGHYGGKLVHTTALPTPGYMVLQQAAMLDGKLGELPLLSAQAVALFAGAAARAFATRVAAVGSDGDGWQKLLSEEGAAADRAALGAARHGFGPPGGDTTYFCCVDRQGNAVSFIQSVAFAFGSGCVVPGTGVVLNNRFGRGAYLIEGHPNEVRPRRRPMHTLNAWMVAGPSGRPQLVGGTPGGDGQVQWNMQLISHCIDHGLEPQEAIELARVTVHPGSDADVVGAPLRLRCEERIGTAVLDELSAAGYPLEVIGPYASGGIAQIIEVRGEGESLLAGSDPRGEGCALGI